MRAGCEDDRMKGTLGRQAAIYHKFNVEDMIEAEHPLRPIRRMVDAALAEMARRPGGHTYAASNRRSYNGLLIRIIMQHNLPPKHPVNHRRVREHKRHPQHRDNRHDAKRLFR